MEHVTLRAVVAVCMVFAAVFFSGMATGYRLALRRIAAKGRAMMQAQGIAPGIHYGAPPAVHANYGAKGSGRAVPRV